eukprot:CAMPEP_0115012832 /NCGR_PEP_ID=MMETSP0216-20121206/24995_1 /TAXON_ID=223996 /ORGANISM="Protocruzia adherens, Strain Boccale" /LENGTH=430 /DNA_ID=CAMNT_0002382011 /DNA_START=173 /DNA_END=1465 /DNA_ORIENTATION=+
MNDTAILLPLGFAFNVCGYPLSHALVQKLGVKTSIIIGWVCITSSAFISSFVTNFYVFVFTYTATFNLGQGLVFLTALLSAWEYYPHQKSTSTGIMTMGYGIGPFAYNFVCLALVNPENHAPSVQSEGGEKYFSADVADRVPAMLRYLGLMWLVTGIIGISILKVPKSLQKGGRHEHIQDLPTPIEDTEEDEDDSITLEATPSPNHSHIRNECLDVRDGLSTSQFKLLTLMGFCSLMLPYYIIDVYKNIGEDYFDNDAFLTTVGSFGLLSNGLSRCLWGPSQDKWGFKKVYWTTLGLQGAMCLLFIFLRQDAVIFTIAVIGACACDGAHFTIFTSETGKVFGVKYSIIFYVFISLGLSGGTLLALVLNKYVRPVIGYSAFFWMFFVLTCCSACLLFWFEPDIDWNERRERSGLIPKEAEKGQYKKVAQGI